jgi:hypothetical protein
MTVDSTKALTRQEVSALIQVTCETLSRWHAQGRGPRCVKDAASATIPMRLRPGSAESGAASTKDIP